MDPVLLLKAAILGLVEGVTEFIPVSSTGHLIIAGDLLGFTGERAKTFEIFIQLGAIFAVVWLYRALFVRVARNLGRSVESRRFVVNLALGFLPAAVVGLATHKWIKAHLFTVPTVAGALVVGGLAILAIERTRPTARVSSVDALGPRTAFGIGVAQVLSLFPGVSRSGATILGGYLLGLTRTAATEFSFFLAIPTLIAAGLYETWKERALLNADDLGMWAVGFIAAFVSAFLCVRWLLRYISNHDFSVFAWYRIVFGLVVIGTAYSGVVNWTNP
jgi:undecaprenyl-diphosphatase